MAIKTGKRYTARVVEGSLYESNRNKTPGFQIILDTEDGTIDYTIWLTPKNRDKALRDFETLGVPAGQLTSRSFLTYELPQAVVGVEVIFEARDEEYPRGSGQMNTKVAWIGKPGAASAEELAGSVAAFFGAAPLDAGPSREAPSAADLNALETDEIVPF